MARVIRLQQKDLKSPGCALQIMSGLIKLAVANEIGTGPSLDEVKERESNATQAASQGHASGRGNESGNRISLHA